MNRELGTFETLLIAVNIQLGFLLGTVSFFINHSIVEQGFEAPSKHQINYTVIMNTLAGKGDHIN